MATHSSILTWRIPWTEEPRGLQSLGSQSLTWLKWLSRHTCRSIYRCWNELNKLNYNGMCAKSCLTLYDPMDCSPPGSSVHGIFQARILKWLAMPSSKGSPQPRDLTHNSCIAGRFFTSESPGKPKYHHTSKQVICSFYHSLKQISETWTIVEWIWLDSELWFQGTAIWAGGKRGQEVSPPRLIHVWRKTP